MPERKSLVAAARRVVSAAKAAAGKAVAASTMPAAAEQPAAEKAPVKKAAAAKKSAPVKKAAAVTKAVPVKRAAPVKKAAPAKKAGPAKKAAPAKKAGPATKAVPVTADVGTGDPAPNRETMQPTRVTSTPALVVREDESPWTSRELAEVRAELAGELDRIARDVETLQSSIADVLRDSGDGAGDDQADTGSKAFEREQEMTLLANTRESLFQTRRALARIDDGSYGSCESCGNAVGKLRLQAFPRATLCVACKQTQERR